MRRFLFRPRIWMIAGAVTAAAAPGVTAAAAPGRAATPGTEPIRPHCVTLPYGEIGGDGHRVAPRVPPGRGGGPALATVPGVGNIHLLVLLAEFSDVPHVMDPARFEQHLFGDGLTLRDYFRDVSGGRLQVTGDVVGWFTLPLPQFAYSQGAGGIANYPGNAQKMTEHAVERAVLAGVDLGDYDADGDGVVDALLVIHSGQGFEWAGSAANTPAPDPNAINSHKWVTVQSEFGSGASVQDYFTCPELQIVRPAQFPNWNDTLATIGVYCHEFGHVLGLPDFYDTNTFENRVGVWDLMDFGTWNRVSTIPEQSAPGSLPGRFSAWSRAFLGWELPRVITPPAGESTAESVLLESASTGAPALQLLSNPGGVDWTVTTPGSGEYFLAEVRTRTGYDAGLPAEGLLLYHVDESQRTNREEDATYPGGGLVVLVPQDDNYQLNTLAGDPWPGQQPTFDGTSDPSSRLFSGKESGVTIADIGPVLGGTVAADVFVTNFAPTARLPFGRPHPWRPASHGDVEIVLGFGNAPGPSTVELFDVLGRHVRTLDTAGEFAVSGRVARWDGRDETGRPMPAGLYVFRAGGAAAGTGKLLLLR